MEERWTGYEFLSVEEEERNQWWRAKEEERRAERHMVDSFRLFIGGRRGAEEC